MSTRLSILWSVGAVLFLAAALAQVASAGPLIISRVSSDTGGGQATGGASSNPSISADGRYVAFHSYATNLVTGDSNANADVFVKDTQTGATTRVSTDSSGAQATGGDSTSPSISADVRYVAFHSGATNLVTGDSNAAADVFVTRSGPNHGFTWYDNVYGANWVLFANPAAATGDAWFDLSVAGAVQALPGNGQVSAGGTLAVRYPGLMGGPVDAGFHAQSPALVSQRVLWAGNSLEEVVGADTKKLSDHFFWTWYDMQSPGFKNWVLVANPGANPVFYRIKLAGTERASGAIAPGAEITPTFPGVMGGPVELEAWADAVGGTVPANVMASQRVLMNNDTDFTEVPGIPATGLSGDYLWNWCDATGGSDWVLVANPPGDAAANIWYQVYIGGVLRSDGTVQPGVSCKGPVADNGNSTPEFPVYGEGPVEVKTFSDASCTAPANAIASQRVTWGPSFEEVPGLSAGAISNTYHWTWYDQDEGPGVTNWVLVANPATPLAPSITS